MIGTIAKTRAEGAPATAPPETPRISCAVAATTKRRGRERGEDGDVLQIAVPGLLAVLVRGESPRHLVGEQHAGRGERQREQPGDFAPIHAKTVPQSRPLVHPLKGRFAPAVRRRALAEGVFAGQRVADDERVHLVRPS